MVDPYEGRQGNGSKDTSSAIRTCSCRFSKMPPIFPAATPAGVTATGEADVARARQTRRRAADRRAVVADRRRDADGRDRSSARARLNQILEIGADFVRVQAGVTLAELDAALASAGRYYPPAPTFFGAFVGGTVATNAAGAATFKYGTTRDWVQALTVVLPSGDVLDVERGATHAHPDGYFEIELARRDRPRAGAALSRCRTCPKLSAGYFAQPAMDLIDLFIGSEGTLGVITEVTLRSCRPAGLLSRARAVCRSQRGARASSAALRDARARHVADRRSARHRRRRRSSTWTRAACSSFARTASIGCTASRFPTASAIALLVTLELPPATTAEQAFDEIGARARRRTRRTRRSSASARLLDEAGVLDEVEIAVPGDRARAEQLLAVREAVPAAVNQRVGRAKQTIDPRIEKTAADMIVPFDGLERAAHDLRRRSSAARARCGGLGPHLRRQRASRTSFRDRSPTSNAGKAAILEFGRDAIRLGGSPLAEHGVGRNAVKQQLLEELYGEDGIEEMRQVKARDRSGVEACAGRVVSRTVLNATPSVAKRRVLDVAAQMSAARSGRLRSQPHDADACCAGVSCARDASPISTCGFSASVTVADFDAPARSSNSPRRGRRLAPATTA